MVGEGETDGLRMHISLHVEPSGLLMTAAADHSQTLRRVAVSSYWRFNRDNQRAEAEFNKQLINIYAVSCSDTQEPAAYLYVSVFMAYSPVH